MEWTEETLRDALRMAPAERAALDERLELLCGLSPQAVGLPKHPGLARDLEHLDDWLAARRLARENAGQFVELDPALTDAVFARLAERLRSAD
jgi:hypothetical protein